MRLCLVLYMVLNYLFISMCFAATDNHKKNWSSQSLGAAAIAGISSALSHADIALCKSIINPSHLKGDYGETIVGKFYLEQHLKSYGSWQSVSARFSRQGIDQIYIKYDRMGRPRDIIVGEVKYGSSRIATTNKDGVQLGQQWTEKRLIALGKRYLTASASEHITIQKRPSSLNVRHQIEIDLGNGKKGIFWREDGRHPWNYEGYKQDLSLAQKKAQSTGQFLKKAGENVIRIKRRIFEVKTEHDLLTIKIKDAKFLDVGIPQNKIKGQTIRIHLNSTSGKSSNQALSEEIAKQIKRKIPYFSDSECRAYAKNIVNNKANVEELKIQGNSFTKSVFTTSLKAGVAGAILTSVVEGISQGLNGRLDYQRLFGDVAFGFGATGAGSAIGQITTSAIIKSKIAHAVVTEAASSLGISSSFVGNTIGASVGAGVTSMLFAYGGYVLGYYDSYTANKIAASGLIGSAGGAIAATGTIALVSSYAVASTGTAISSLSGAAATNAALAYLGGGAVASGGGGVALGTAVLGGIVTVVIVGVSTTSLYLLHLHDAKEENKLLGQQLEFYKTGNCFLHQATRLYPLHSSVFNLHRNL